MTKHFLFLVIILSCFACGDIEFEAEKIVYSNDFESQDLSNLEGIFISNYNGSKVMGPYNNAGLGLVLDNLPDHEFIRLSFDLFIHDSWEGNTPFNGNNLFRNHDAWIIEFDSADRVKPAEKIYFETTFSNSLCDPLIGFCHSQSYPNEFPFPNDARTGSLRNLPGMCSGKDSPSATAHYRIEKTFPHRRRSTKINIYDRLTNFGAPSNICDESWSIDNLTISVFTVK